MAAITSFVGQLLDQTFLAAVDPLCNPAMIALPAMKGLEVLSVEAFARRNHTFPASTSFGYSEPINNMNFCNVTVTYTHPGWGDSIHVMSYLPFEDEWNGKFMANGGGGLMAGGELLSHFTMIPSLMEGFAASITDAGYLPTIAEAFDTSKTWTFSNPGNVNWPLFMNFAHVAIHDMATIGKAVTEAFYHKAPEFSYFLEGSTGGRQAHMLAQRYPEDFDGIISVCPAINWPRFLFSNLYAAVIMEKLNQGHDFT
ncbi:tannase and feruloyl esterase-domain-containing protein [Dactylonectria macrodidyma]|uniref:Carboxylic ester hydrolase n=1 Tax=Dactylonectria macrodidyma TaxID=307937 RepID=A0A9P9IWH4_9HYPO|nr:tannase and feruloyl esterase-domain-containing protein [Dactylonectria macrodidyma]